MHKRTLPVGTVGLVAGAIFVGLLLRVVGLADNVYWVDEVHTALRLAGYTKETVVPLLTQPTTAGELTPFQGTAAALPDTLRALAQHPEHPPLYYLMAWGTLALGRSALGFVGGLRGVSVFWGLWALPATYWLCWELWRSPRVSALALALVTLSPLHVLYAQEAREYSLWTSMILFSSAVLLRSLRRGGGGRWAVYGITVVLGLYSHLLFGVVMLAHGSYVLITTRSKPGRCGAYVLATALAIAAFLPWVWVGLQRLGQMSAVADAVQRDTSLGYLINVWSRNLNRVFFNGDWGTANLLILGLALYGLYFLWHSSPRPASALFVGLLVAIPALTLLVPDLVLGGIRSTRIRYLIPVYLGVQLAIAHLFVGQLQRRRSWAKQIWGLGLAAILLGSGGASLASTQTPLSWAKSDKSAYYPAMAEAINASEAPWVISDSSVTYLLALARLLKPTTTLQLVEASNLGSQLGPTVFLFDPSPPLKRAIRRRYGPLQLRVEQNSGFQLWQLRPSQ